MSNTAHNDPVEALQALGYAEREERFLYVVAAHSGYFLRRQYETFAGLARGASASRFLQRALAAEHIRSIPHSNRTEVFHLFSRPVYRAIGAEDNRNRRQRPHYSVKAKVMTLDFVLGRRDRRFLATEHEKLEYFVGARGIDRDRLPGKTYTTKSSGVTTRRYFIEKSPIYFEPDEGSPVPSFCYVDQGALSTSGFTSFLNRYRPLFASLRRFRLTYVAAERRPFRRALGVRPWSLRALRDVARLPGEQASLGAARRVLSPALPSRIAPVPPVGQGQAGPPSDSRGPLSTPER